MQSKFRLWKEERELWDSVAPLIALRRAIEAGQGADRVREALEAGATPSLSLGDGSSLLHSAITRGQCENVEVLLDYGADVERSGPYSPRPGIGQQSASRIGPALFAAVDCNQPTNTKIQMIRILLAHGADIRCERGEENLMDLAASTATEQSLTSCGRTARRMARAKWRPAIAWRNSNERFRSPPACSTTVSNRLGWLGR